MASQAAENTLINALIGDDVLRSDALQGTTAAATTLQYAQARDAEVTWTNGKLARFTKSASQEGLLAWVHRYTSEEFEAQRVSNVVIDHPSPMLRDGLVIIDTPGLNADNERHLSVTVQAVRAGLSVAA